MWNSKNFLNRSWAKSYTLLLCGEAARLEPFARLSERPIFFFLLVFSPYGCLVISRIGESSGYGVCLDSGSKGKRRGAGVRVCGGTTRPRMQLLHFLSRWYISRPL